MVPEAKGSAAEGDIAHGSTAAIIWESHPICSLDGQMERAAGQHQVFWSDLTNTTNKTMTKVVI